MLPSELSPTIPFADESSDAGLTPVVPTFSGLDPQAVPHELLGTLERYKLVARLGHGGMAEVFLAAWEVAPFVHRPVVIKRLHAHFTEDQSLVQMFLDEAKLLCLLDHPHVVKTLEAGVIEGRCCIAMEYLEGQPLHRVLRRAYQRGALPVEFAVAIAVRVLDGLHYAHGASDPTGQALEIVHRDVSPHNVLVTNDGQVKVLDFGIAKATTQEGRTATGIVKGKVGYIAPEQAAAEAVDRRADVWSVGVLLWEALTGQRLFKAETDAGTLALTLRGEIPSAGTCRPGLPVELETILARALQRSPALRYPTALAMKQDLQGWLASAGRAPDAGALGGLMGELFASEIVEQRRVVSVLMARSDCTPPSSSSTPSPSSTSALILNSPGATSADLSHVSDRVDDLNRRHRRAFRSLLALLALSAGFAWGVVCFVVARMKTPSALSLAAPSAPTPPRKTEPPGSQAPVIAGAGPTPAVPVAATPQRLTPSTANLLRAVSPHAVARVAPIPPATSVAPAHADVPPSFGFLTIDTTPWSFVSVAGKPLGQTPLVGVKLPSGSQVLSLRNPELGIETSFAVTIEAGKTAVRRVGIE